MSTRGGYCFLVNVDRLRKCSGRTRGFWDSSRKIVLFRLEPVERQHPKTRRDEDERKTGIEEKLDTAVGETTAAEFIRDQQERDPLERARRFDEMFRPGAKRAS